MAIAVRRERAYIHDMTAKKSETPFMKVALLQMNGHYDPMANIGTITHAIGEAKANGADMVFTPEMSNILDKNRKRAAGNIRVFHEDPLVKAACAAAKTHGIWVNLGSVAVLPDEADADEAGAENSSDTRWRNRSVVINDKGEILRHYDKMHLFDVSLDTGEKWQESAAYCPGASAEMVKSPWGNIGLSICYDIRFPALFQALSGAGADILTIPAAFTVPTGRAHWELLLRARAVENACFVIAAAQYGDHADGRQTWGHSMVVDPWGKILLNMDEKTGLGYAMLDFSAQLETRQHIPILQNRQTVEKVIIHDQL